MKLYKFRPLLTCCNYDRIISIIRDGFYCCRFLDFNDMNEGVFTVTHNTHRVELCQKLEYRICSFSAEKALNCQLMWGHYAGAGMGVAIEIEVEPVSPIEKVKYGKEYTPNSVTEILTNKSTQWRYEREWRYLSDSPDEYYKVGITNIYFGTPYRNLMNYDKIKLKHHRLQKYLQRSTTLQAECSKRKILYNDYTFA